MQLVNYHFKNLTGALLLLFVSVSSARAQMNRPNIVLIIGDDIGYYDMGCYGSTSAATPNIDRMAKEGMKFNNVFLTASSCSPSRASIITGRYPHNTGAAELHTVMPQQIVTFPRLLKAAGYYTAASGKWHLGPELKKDFHKVQENNKEIGEGGEDGWIATIRQCPAGQPFFLWLASKDAHRPWGNNAFAGLNSRQQIVPGPSLAPSLNTIEDLGNYYDEITRFDHFVGLVEQELERKGVLNQTLIIIMSDNGAPYPHAKARLYDPGMRTPFIVKGLGASIRTHENNDLISAVDIAPTLLELAGLSPSTGFQGKSFAKSFTKPGKKFRRFAFGEHNWHDFEALERSVRTDGFLYIHNARPQLSNPGAADVLAEAYYRDLDQLHQTGKINLQQAEPFLVPRAPEELYDTRRDPFQFHNLASAKGYQSRLKKMRRVLKKWKKQTKDSDPSQLTPDWFHRKDGKPLPVSNQRGTMPGGRKALSVKKGGPF